MPLEKKEKDVKIMTKCHFRKNIYDFMSYKRRLSQLRNKTLCDLVKMLFL